MAIVTVRIFIDDQDANDLDGVLVRVFESDGATFVTSGTTGAVDPGQIDFSLDGTADPGTTYRLRFSKNGVSFTQPITIAVKPNDRAPAPRRHDPQIELVTIGQPLIAVVLRHLQLIQAA